MDDDQTGVRARFRALLNEAKPAERDPLMRATDVAQACRDTLAVASVAISLRGGDLSVPIGASDVDAAHAEQLQFSLGEGPAIEALSTAEVIAAHPSTLQARWSLFHRRLFDETPYRAVMTVPLRGPDRAALVLDLCLNDPEELAKPSLSEVAWVGEEAMRVLSAEPALTSFLGSGDEPAGWLTAPGARGRLAVWVVTGMLMARFTLRPDDALELLRVAAFARSATVDDLCRAILDREVALEALTP